MIKIMSLALLFGVSVSLYILFFRLMLAMIFMTKLLLLLCIFYSSRLVVVVW